MVRGGAGFVFEIALEQTAEPFFAVSSSGVPPLKGSALFDAAERPELFGKQEWYREGITSPVSSKRRGIFYFTLQHSGFDGCNGRRNCRNNIEKQEVK